MAFLNLVLFTIALFSLILLLALLICKIWLKMSKVIIVVLGDIGRSPRMQYHALSLADEGYLVNIVAFKGSDPTQRLANHSNVKFKYLLDCPDFKKYLSHNLAYILKTLYLSFTLMLALILSGIPKFILVQSPPAIPALGVCYLYSRLTFSTFIVDWHNYAYTILALTLGNNHWLVYYCRRFEFWFGRRSDANICVTKAMRDDLDMKGIDARVLYDRPPGHFQPITINEKHKLITSLASDYPVFVRNCRPGETVFTYLEGREARLRNERPGLVISSTSWTEDEDFNLLLEALQDYEDGLKSGKPLPQLVVAVTGKGPLREFYLEIVKKRKWQNIEFITPWLTSQDYPKFLSCGDLGVSLHFSSSQLDLPMKVVDMFGCGLPVAAVNYKCLNELVIDKENGLIFETSKELGLHLMQWFTNFPSSLQSPLILDIQENLSEFRRLTWHKNWTLTVLPFFTRKHQI